MAGWFFTTGPPRKPQNMNCSEIKHGFYLLFHTPYTEQIFFFPNVHRLYFFKIKVVSLPSGPRKRGLMGNIIPCLCSRPDDLACEHMLGLPEFSNHNSRSVSALVSQGCLNLWLTHLFRVPGEAPPILASSWPIMESLHLPQLHFSFSFFPVYVYIDYWKVHVESHTGELRVSSFPHNHSA